MLYVCISLVAEWLDDHNGTDFLSGYYNMSNRDFLRYYKSGMRLWYEDHGFKEVNNLQIGDCLVYGDSVTNLIPNNHIGIYVSKDKILHHLPGRFSSIDTIDYSKIIGCYRYD